MTLLITGPTGPVGQYILEQALVADDPVRVLALPESLHRVPYRNQITIVPGSLEDDEALAEAVKSVDTVFHTATIAPPPPRSPDELHRTNVDGTRRLLEACAGDIKRFVFVSTAAVYPAAPNPDEWPLHAGSPRLAHGVPQLAMYRQSMIDAEDLVREASERYGMEYVILRPTVVCGRTAKFAESIVSELMRTPGRAEELSVGWGTMQWVHGADVARAAHIACRHPAARNESFIVAGDEIVTAFSVLATLWDIIQTEAGDNPYSADAARRCPPRQKFDTDKLRDGLGFTAEATVRQCIEELLGRYEFYSSASLKMPASQGLLEIE